jgi:hypothetical protein
MYNQDILDGIAETALSESTGQARADQQPASAGAKPMDAHEAPFIRITDDDVNEANQLSLQCPICGNAVENHADGASLVPVVCDACGTLYHRACWEQSGGKCAVLGCGHDKYHVYGRDNKPVLKVKYTDLPAPSANGHAPTPQTRRLKEEQRRQVEQMQKPGFWQRVWQWLLDQIKVG